ncbi:MAG: YdiL family protein, partial [Gracilibacteraceae bacterium]|nr:YdiL family protein [Gracilibacteraceae bacterium]
MLQLTQLTARRDEIVEEIGRIQSMRKGVLNATYQKVPHKNGEVAIKGPYYVLSRKGAGGKTVSR